MRKVMATISTLLICVSVLAGCGKADPVQTELINYINNQVPTLVEPESKVATEYKSIVEDNDATDATLAQKLKDVIIPANEQLLAIAKAIVPTTEEVKKVHNKYIAAVTEQGEGFKLMLQTALEYDESVLKAANAKIEHSDIVTKEFLADLDVLKKEHNVVDKEK